MKNLVKLLGLLVCFVALCFALSSCKEPTKDGSVVFTNSSSYAEDNPVRAELYKGSEILATNSVSKGSKVTWTDVPPEVSLSIKATDKEGRSTSTWSFSLSLNETRKFSYNGASINQVYD